MAIEGSFAERVKALHEGWVERRLQQLTAGAYDRESQLASLRRLYRWAVTDVAAAAAVYDEALVLTITPPPDPPQPRFSVLLDGQPALTFSLLEHGRAGGSHWHIGVTANGVAVAPRGPWTRARLEERLLAVLANHERSQAGVALPLRPTSAALWGDPTRVSAMVRNHSGEMARRFH